MNELISLVSVAALLLGTPGPAPLALAATGASAGVRQGLPFLAGILFGLLVASIGAAVALSLILEINPIAKSVVHVFGVAYITYVAYKIASGPVLNDSSGQAQAGPSFIDGFFINLLNPKAYAAFFVLFSQFSLSAQSLLLSLLYTGTVSFLVAVIADLLWLLLGGAIAPLFREPRSARLLRISFAALMILTVLGVVTA